MLALLLAVALVALTILALLLLGVAAAVITGILLLNAFVLLIGVRSPRQRPTPSTSGRWRPRAFRHPPQPPLDPESEEQLRSGSLTAHRR